jgi:hypothetical protein
VPHVHSYGAGALALIVMIQLPIATAIEVKTGRLIAACLAALVLHVALFQWVLSSTHAKGGVPATSHGSVFSIRTIEAVADAVEHEDAAPAPPSMQAQPVVRAAASPSRRPASLDRPAPDEEAYAEPGMLTARPTPIDDISISAPEVAGRSGAFKASMVLFIDSAGTVMRISFDDSSLPPDLEAAARTAFALARFRPGMIGHRPVKSKLRVEVAFETDTPAK